MIILYTFTKITMNFNDEIVFHDKDFVFLCNSHILSLSIFQKPTKLQKLNVLFSHKATGSRFH